MSADAATTQVGQKRKHDDAGPEESAQKKSKLAGQKSCDESDVAAAAPAQVPTPVSTDAPKPKLGLTAIKGANMFYPETYDKFDPDCLITDGDPQTSKVWLYTP